MNYTFHFSDGTVHTVRMLSDEIALRYISSDLLSIRVNDRVVWDRQAA